jgi:uncharacterized protein with WD repeat
MTAIVTPRLRMDNCYKVYSYTGTQLSKMGYEQTELYGVYWLKPIKYIKENSRGLSPNRKIEMEPKK